MEYDIASLLGSLDIVEIASAEKTQISADAFANLMGLLDTPTAPRAANGEGMTNTERSTKRRNVIKKRSLENIAVLDFETDPFDNIRKSEIFPFLAVLYSDNFEPVIIWDETRDAFTQKVVDAIEALPEAYTIYAHNGGKFDYMFLMKHLRGEVMFKGRGIMTAKIGKHELRDSFHIIPDRLANFKKDHIDYANMHKKKRNKFRDEIIRYCINDCKYLLDIVKGFANRFGLKLSIGQAAMGKLRENYKFSRVSETTDGFLRQWFFGGRVECLAGKGHYKGRYKLYDVNSMYPAVMANYEHPVGSMYINHTGAINDHTFFIDLTCDSRGAFVLKTDDNATNAPHGRHRFKTTIWEYNVAKKHNLISNEEIHGVVDCMEKTSFINFVAPLYNERQHVKAKRNDMETRGLKDTPEYDELIKDDMFLKFLLNNAYGKFAQNPRRYKEHYISAPDEAPEGDEWGDLPESTMPDYWVWSRPSPSDRYNNVGTGASITGAARSVLLDAIHNAKGAIYCDTDSLICLELTNVQIHKTDLGAWDLEKELSEIIINGKKLYSTMDAKGTLVTKSKGAGNVLSIEQLELLDKLEDGKEKDKIKARYSWDSMLAINLGGTITTRSTGVTLTKTGKQFYMDRRISATALEPMTG